MKHSSHKKNHKITGVIIAILAITAVVGGGVYLIKHKVGADKTATTMSNEDKSKINYDPPTEEEKQQAEDNKKAIVEREKAIAAQPDKPTVKPVIVDASQYDSTIEVRAYIPGIIEDGGTCTATFTKGTATIKKQSAGSKDATTTRCSNFEIPRSEFPSAGNWQMVLTYSSSAHEGSAEPKTVEVK